MCEDAPSLWQGCYNQKTAAAAMVQPIKRFSLGEHIGPRETWGTTSELFVDHAATGRRIPGLLIEGQYACDAGYVLIMSYDCSFEESLTFLLLDPEFRIVSERTLEAMYNSYLLMKNYVIGDNDIGLELAGEDRPWTLKVRPNSWPSFRRLRIRRPAIWDR